MKIEEELIQTGAIVQDNDSSVPQPEAERRFSRYVELVDSITGGESSEVLRALFCSIQVKDDYGAYQRTLGALTKFQPQVFAEICIEELPRLIEDFPDWAGDILVGLPDNYVVTLNHQLTNGDGDNVRHIVKFVREQEKRGGWLDAAIGMIAPGIEAS